MIGRRALLAAALALPATVSRAQPARTTNAEPWAAKLIAAAEHQVGRTLLYQPAYVRLPYPNGDVPLLGGVCTDVVIRAYRAGLGIDLQRLVHEDMARAFSAYPHQWGLKRPDSNIDHRRVPNLETFFRRQGALRPVSAEPDSYLPGDLVTQRLPGNLPHILVVTHHRSLSSGRPLAVHNIGLGARLEDAIMDYPIAGHFRFAPRT